MKLRIGENIRSEIWEIQIINFQQPLSKFYKATSTNSQPL